MAELAAVRSGGSLEFHFACLPQKSSDWITSPRPLASPRVLGGPLVFDLIGLLGYFVLIVLHLGPYQLPLVWLREGYRGGCIEARA